MSYTTSKIKNLVKESESFEFFKLKSIKLDLVKSSGEAKKCWRRFGGSKRQTCK